MNWGGGVDLLSEESIVPEDMGNNVPHTMEHNLGQYIGNKRINKKSHMEECEKLQCPLAQDSRNEFGSLSVILAGQKGSRRAFRTNTHNFHMGFSAQ